MTIPSKFKEYRLLVVDDSDYARAQMTALLTQAGFTVVGEAASAEDALRQVRDKKPHLVLMDIVMPQVSGIQLTEKIVTDFSNVGVIMVSSLTHEQVVLESIAAGAVDFINKPINPQQLTESVEKFLTNLGKDL
jgi:two-component system, chemotaxis family, chemotaxis protein CheY